MQKQISKIIFLFAVFLMLPHFALAAPDPPYIDNDFVLFWSNPTRAYPGIDLDFRFVVYEKDNQPLTWQLSGGPAAMTVDNNGKITWIPTDADVGSYTVTVRVTRQQGDYIERSFPLTVGTSDFVFVSTTGNDSNDGTKDHPFATMEHAMRSITTSNGSTLLPAGGKTILVMGGVYKEHYNWDVNGVSSPFRFVTFTQADPMEIRSYPGQNAILDCELQGHGLIANGAYMLIDNIEVENAGAGERAGIAAYGSHHIIRDTKVHDSNWSYSNNCTGYKSQATDDIVFDNDEGYNNRDVNSTHWNNSNYLVYLDSAVSADAKFYILNSKSHDSISGFKIKHAGLGKLILHNDLSINDVDSFAIGSSNSSVRHSIAVNGSDAIVAGIADPNAYTNDSVLIENNTIINAKADAIFFQSSNYLKNGSIVRNNILYNDTHVAGTYESDYRLMGLWYYSATASSNVINSDYNLFYSPSQNNIIRLGNTNYNYSFTSWKGLGHDANSFFENPVFANYVSGNYHPSTSSNACSGASDGGYIGALPCLDNADFTAPSAPSGISVE